MNINYVVFLISTKREIYGDDTYYVLGEKIASFKTEKDAENDIKSLNLKTTEECIILKTYSGKKGK